MTIKLYNSETVLVKVVNAKVEREGLAGASHISSSDSVIITGCPPGIELVTTERRDHRHRHHEDVSPCHFCEILSQIFSAARSNTALHIFVTDRTILGTQSCFVRVKFRVE